MATEPLADNSPTEWKTLFPWPAEDTHKYARGGVAVAGGGIAATGAARLTARAALRIGAGAVTIACDAESLPVYASHLTSVMTRIISTPTAFRKFAEDKKITSLALGPGLGHGNHQARLIKLALGIGKPVVLDADALTQFEARPQTLFALTANTTCVLTPHEGEFARLFGGHVKAKARHLRAAAAAKLAGCVVLLKGQHTLIASPGGRLVENRTGSPYLATAGSGDVLTGMIAGLLAQGMPPFEAACAAAWMHGKAGAAFGPGLIAEDLPEQIPAILASLRARPS